MSDQQRAPRSADQDAAHPLRRVGRPWANIVDEQIRDAVARGEFDNLPGAGQPLHLTENPFAGERAAAFNLLKSQGMAPREIELGREIDAELAALAAPVARLRWRRDELSARLVPPFASERRAYDILRAGTREAYADGLSALNRKILTLNITAPSALHRPMLDVAALLRAFDEEFRPLAR